MRPRGGRHRRGAEHRVPGRGLRTRPRAGRRHRGRREPAHQRARGVGGGGLRQRHLDRRLAAARAALVHGARPGTRGRGVDDRRRGRLPPRHLVQLGQVLRPRVHDRGLGPGAARFRATDPVPPPKAASRPGSSARRAPFGQRAHRLPRRSRGRLQHAGRPLEPRAAAGVDRGAPAAGLGAGATSHEAQFDEEFDRRVPRGRGRDAVGGGTDAGRPPRHVPRTRPEPAAWPAWVLSAVLVASYLVLYFTDVLDAPGASRSASAASGRCTASSTRWPWSSAARSSCAATATAGTSAIRTISVIVLSRSCFAFALPARDDGARAPRVLLQLLLAAEDRVPVPATTSSSSPSSSCSTALRLAGRVPGRGVLPRQALLLLVDLRLRRAGQHGRGAVAPPVRASRRRRGASRRSRSTRCSRWPS